MGLFPLRRISSRGVRSTRACLTRHLPTSGFLTLLPVCSSSGRVGLFHPTNAHGVSPFKVFPSRPRRPARHRPCPLLPLPLAAEAAEGRLQGFPPVRESVRTFERFRLEGGRYPPGLSSSSGFDQPCNGHGFPSPPLMRLGLLNACSACRRSALRVNGCGSLKVRRVLGLHPPLPTRRQERGSAHQDRTGLPMRSQDAPSRDIQTPKRRSAFPRSSVDMAPRVPPAPASLGPVRARCLWWLGSLMVPPTTEVDIGSNREIGRAHV